MRILEWSDTIQKSEKFLVFKGVGEGYHLRAFSTKPPPLNGQTAYSDQGTRKVKLGAGLRERPITAIMVTYLISQVISKSYLIFEPKRCIKFSQVELAPYAMPGANFLMQTAT